MNPYYPPPSDDVEMATPLAIAGPDFTPVAEEEIATVDIPLTGRFTWKIENFSKITTNKIYSNAFYAGGYKWRILLFPKGNNVRFLSIYLDVADSANLSDGCSLYAQYSLAVINQIQSKFSIRKETQHQFNSRETDWGFTLFMPLPEVYDQSNGFLVKDILIIEADVATHRVTDYFYHESKKENSYVGLKNQGATCYMNSLLQTLYHIPCFRKAVYHMPTNENDIKSSSMPLALQTLFYNLQYSDTSVATEELTKSFGWDTLAAFTQHDAHEFNRSFCATLEEKMKGTDVEGTIQQLFGGHLMTYIECIDVDYKSTRIEPFCDIQLDVKGCRDVYASFDKYVEVERLEGDNRYQSGQHGFQDAKKGVLVLDFPPVLQLHLKRFEFDHILDSMSKINDYYEFPLELDLDRDNGKYLAPGADRSIRNLYTLHSVLVHSGGANAGHYYAYIRPTLSEQWFKFDDERVTKEDKKKALQEQFGGEIELPGFINSPFKFLNDTNAYMLVYIRKSDQERIICHVDRNHIAEHLRIRLKREQEENERKKKETEEAHLYRTIKVAREEDLHEQIGKHIYFDLVDHERVRCFQVKKQVPFNVFKEEVAKEFGIPVQFQRFWLWALRKNDTYRIHRPLTPKEEVQAVGLLRELGDEANKAELRLFLEVAIGEDLWPILPPEKSGEDMLLFFKLYDPAKQELRYVGRLFVKDSNVPVEVLSQLKEMVNFAPEEEIILYEEVSYNPSVSCSQFDMTLTFFDNEFEDGDIICFQKAPQEDSIEEYCYPEVPSFLEYVRNRQAVRFRALDKAKDEDFCIELSKLLSYDNVVERVAQHLGLDDPSRIRLTSHNCYSQQPKSQPIDYRGAKHLSEMLTDYDQTSDILYYEVLNIPLPELEFLKSLEVVFHSTVKNEVITHTIKLPEQSTVGDVLDNLKKKVSLSRPDAELRLLKVYNFQIKEIFPLSTKIDKANDKIWTLRAEEIPEEERNLGPHGRLVHAHHFMTDRTRNQIRNFGVPFVLVVYEGETLADVKVRIQKKLQVPAEDFSKWRFACISLGGSDYLEDSDILLSTFFQRRDVYTSWDQYLGLEHTDHTPKRSYVASKSQSLRIYK